MIRRKNKTTCKSTTSLWRLPPPYCFEVISTWTLIFQYWIESLWTSVEWRISHDISQSLFSLLLPSLNRNWIKIEFATVSWHFFFVDKLWVSSLSGQIWLGGKSDKSFHPPRVGWKNMKRFHENDTCTMNKTTYIRPKLPQLCTPPGYYGHFLTRKTLVTRLPRTPLLISSLVMK